MVKSLSKKEEDAISEAAQQLVQKTGAKLVPVILSASGSYSGLVLAFGICIGTLFSVGLWLNGTITAYPCLLATQIVSIVIAINLPSVRRFCISMLPEKFRHRKARRVALEEYHVVMHTLPMDTPFVLLFVSLAERYVHVVTSPAVKRKLPDEHWEAVTRHFTDLIKSKGLHDASINTIRHIEDLMTPHFPSGA